MNSVPMQADFPATESSKVAPCELLAPPPTVVSIEPKPGEGPHNWIDYRQHPAYAPLVQQASFAERIKSLSRFAFYFGVIVCKRLSSYELIPAHVRRSGSLRGAIAFAGSVSRNACQKLVPSLRHHRPGRGGPILRALNAHGLCVAKMEPSAYARVRTAVSPLIAELRRARGMRSGGGREFEESRGAAIRTAHAELFIAVEDMLAQSGALDACSSYIGYRAKLVDVNPQVNDPSDDFWQRIFPDLGARDRPAAYFHRDASGGDIKAILYLSDVGPQNGPFCYAVGSHRVRSSTLENWVEETNDQSGFSGTDSRSRRLFAALPNALQRKCAFGNDMESGTQIVQRLLGSQWSIEAPQGYLVLFDTKGIHRGGMVREGERVVLTCVIGSARR
jgi:hypothetical protein